MEQELDLVLVFVCVYAKPNETNILSKNAAWWKFGLLGEAQYDSKNKHLLAPGVWEAAQLYVVNQSGDKNDVDANIPEM